MASEDTKPPKPTPETAPDPEEDDLDDLDDMLDEFAASKIDNSKTTQPSTSVPTADPGPSGPGRPELPNVPQPSVDEEDEFAGQLQAGMAEMLRELESNPEMAKHFEEMMAQFGAPLPPPGAVGASQAAPATTSAPSPGIASPQPPSQPGSSNSAKAQDETFQDTIRRTMERMRESSDKASSNPNPADDDMMAAMLRELAAGNGGGDGDDTFSKMLAGMMEQLTNKEILYEPMKELDTKFPAWLGKNGAGLPAEERERYELQRGVVRDIVGRFERAGYSDSNAQDREYIVEKMQTMQAAGAPPPDLVGDVNAAEEMFGGGADTGCPQQ